MAILLNSQSAAADDPSASLENLIGPFRSPLNQETFKVVTFCRGEKFGDIAIKQREAGTLVQGGVGTGDYVMIAGCCRHSPRMAGFGNADNIDLSCNR